MNQKVLITIALFFIFVSSSFSTVWRVNNRPNVNAHFTTLQAAVDGASAGDTIYLEGSPNSYGNGTFTKMLTVIGPGYFLSENDTTQAYKNTAITGNLSFNTGSEGSVICGLDIRSTGYNQTIITITANSIRLYRNKVESYHNYNLTIHIAAVLSNTMVEQNWLTGQHVLHISQTQTNCTIRNNFIWGSTAITTPNDPNNDILFNNNVVNGNFGTTRTTIVNNILVGGSYNNGWDDMVSNNLCNSTQFALSPNPNMLNVDMYAVFVNYGSLSAVDKNCRLRAASPARGYGIDGTDCGMFSTGMGGDPYILSGIPNIPSVFSATIGTVGTGQLPVNIKARSNR